MDGTGLFSSEIACGATQIALKQQGKEQEIKKLAHLGQDSVILYAIAPDTPL